MSASLAWQDRAGWWLASVGGLGRSPIAPGTVGSAAGVALYWVLPADPASQGIAILGFTWAGLWASNVIARTQHDSDPPIVIIDELTGMLLACFLLPKEPGALLAAFGLFRLLDITKWFLIRSCERLPGGWGIMLDDLAAGALTRLVLLVWFR
jgi:phosphatidylglycerophosphatase A